MLQVLSSACISGTCMQMVGLLGYQLWHASQGHLLYSRLQRAAEVTVHAVIQVHTPFKAGFWQLHNP